MNIMPYKDVSNELILSSTRKIKSLPHLLEEVMKLTAHIAESVTVVERIWLIKNNYENVPHCPNGKAFNWVDGNVGYRFCGRAANCECAKINHSKKISAAKKLMSSDKILASNEKRKNTVIKKYGVDYVSQDKTFREAVEKTSFEKYGHKTSLQNDYVKEKIIKTNVEKYGFKNPMQNSAVAAKTVETLKEYYGNNFTPFMRREEFTSIMVERHGVEHALQNEDFLKQRSKTNLERWGSENHMQNSAMVQKMRKTSFENFGVPHFKQVGYTNNDIELVQNESFFRDEYKKLGIDGILENYSISRVVLRNLLVKYDIEYDKNLTAPERIIENILKENNIEYILRNRSVIKPLELDFYIPSKKLAIEVCGLYWHSEENGKEKSYHLNKLERCEKLGIRLITIFDDELSNIELIRHKIRYALGQSDRICGARQVKILEISVKEARDFLNKNHIQGYCNSVYRLGAFYKENLVAVMTFGNLRSALGSKSVQNHWELLRLASLNSIPGVASKLFLYFLKNKKPEKIISYCDRRWGSGKVYREMGMTFAHNSPPGYWYVSKDCLKRFHRFNFTKSKLVKEGFDSNLTEREIMISRGYRKIWDCGHSKWIWDNK